MIFDMASVSGISFIVIKRRQSFGKRGTDGSMPIRVSPARLQARLVLEKLIRDLADETVNLA